MIRPFMQCDVFSTHPTGGNGLAVVLDGTGLSDDQMQAFARWTNLAETTFVCPATDAHADYLLRIFTTARELPFAGHPTLGSAACWLAAGHTPRAAGKITQQCGVGLVTIDLTGDTPAFIAPPTAIAPMPANILSDIAGGLNLDPARILRHAVLDNGPVWHVIEMESASDLTGLDASAITPVPPLSVGLIGAQDAGADTDYEVRMFSMFAELKEDPITGSLNAALAHWMQDQGRADTPYVVAQGTCIGRKGRVHVAQDADKNMRIGGHTSILIRGDVTL
ncbi:PhzF family phenazine biosynthesis protein [Octadecabacter sp. R77987]|uniref:PhzF family phenazine biosynthesis protein n=1 Tax=Octadecabacter sp. R77987 TaxID=3093874 RepID=UPI00366E40CF